MKTKHPEQKENELFITNWLKSKTHEFSSDFQSPRFGNIAYDIQGNVAEGCCPVFVLVSEVEELENGDDFYKAQSAVYVRDLNQEGKHFGK